MIARYIFFWRYLPLRTQLLVGLLLPFGVLGVSAYLVYQTLESAAAETGQAETSMRSVSLRQALMNSVLDAETGERGFVITGQERFLEPYQEAQRAFDRALAELRELEGGNGSELEELAEVERLFHQWKSEVADPVIKARRESPGLLFSRGFGAYFQLHELLAHLSGDSALSPPEQEKRLDGVVAGLDEAVALGRQTVESGRWRPLLRQAERFREAYEQVLADEAAAQARATARESGERLAAMLRSLLHAARQAEAEAAEIVAAGRGKALMDEIRNRLGSTIDEELREHRRLSESSREHMRDAKVLAISLPPVVGLFGLVLMLLIGVDVIRSVRALRDGAERVASGQLNMHVRVDRADELGGLAERFNVMADQLAGRRDETRLLNALQSMLASSGNAREAYEATRRCCERLLPDLAGSLCLIAPSRDVAEAVVGWGEPAASAQEFAMEDCRAIRTGRTYQAAIDAPEVFCDHAGPDAVATLCVPLVSQDEVLGVLHVYRSSTGAGTAITSHERELAVTVAEHLALALSNLSLAEKLRTQAIRDPLTGAFNRRYLEETLGRELLRAGRAGESLGVLVVDADHFKAFNDRFGHGAGDLVLQKLVATMQSVVRPSDMICRSGGEEFVVVLPEAAEDQVSERAQALRERIQAMDLDYHGESLGQVTVSIGVAVYPQHGKRGDELIRAADAALYRAKREGRNRVVTADT